MKPATTHPPISLITGGTGALGQVVCQVLLAAGHQVIVTYRVDHELKALLEAIGNQQSQLTAYRINVTDEASLEELADKVKRQFGSLTNLICLVGGFLPGTLTKQTGNDFQTLFELNALSFALACEALAPLLKPQKKDPSHRHIIGIAAKPALEPVAGLGLYAASKAALASLVQSLSEELRDQSITVNAIAPSTIDTHANRQAMPKANPANWVKPEAIAKLILYLTRAEADSISGTVIPIYNKA